MKASERLARRYPLAWGMTKWGPLPETRDMWIVWDGPGTGLQLYARDPDKPGVLSKRIEHPSASAVYDTVDAAENAVNAFIRAGLEGSS